MTQYNFGIGSVIGTRTDIAGVQPSFFGTIQDISIDIDQALVELYGQLKMPVDVAPSKLSIKGKAKFARIQISQLNNMLLGDTVTTASGFDMGQAESHAVGAVTTFTATNGTSFTLDLGVFYHSNGVQLVPVASAPTVGQYVAPTGSPGTYTIAVADENKTLDIYYTYGVTTLNQLVGTNNFMGTGPIFKLSMSNHYTNNLGINAALNLQLNACRSSKFTFPFNNVQYTIPDFEFTAFADSSGNWGTLATTE